MAFTDTYDIFFEIRDREQKAAILGFRVGADGVNLTSANLDAYASALEALLDVIIKGDIRKAAYTKVLSIFTGNSAEDSADVEEQIATTWNVIGTTKKKTLSFPAVSENYVDPATGRLLIEQGDVANLITALRDGVDVGGNDIRMLDSENRPIDSLSTGIETFRKPYKRRN